MDFDFTTHLSKLLSIPPSQITIRSLTGGEINITVRASFTPPVDLTQFGHPQSVSSVVLKYTPPYLVSDPSIPVNTFRQDIEARSLLLLDPRNKSALPVSSLFAKHPNIKIPRFIHHDYEKRVLIMTDLGSVVKIDDWLTQEPAPNSEDVERIAKDLGRFLAEFFITTSEPNIELLPLLPNSVLVDAFNLYVVNALKAVLPSYGVSDAEILIKRVADMARDSRETDLCLGMVDLWCNNIVIDSDKNVCLVDWEYFGLSNASCEMSLLGESFFPGSISMKPCFSDILYDNSAIIALELTEIISYGHCEEVHYLVY